MSEAAQNLDPSLPKPGDLLLGKYRIEKILGQGGMGIVYKANHEILGVPVAIKLLLTDIATSQEAVTRFMNEARRAMEIQSENVAKVSDAGHLDGGRPYMVIEYLDGNDLSKVLERDGVLQIQIAIDYTLQALEALAQAHSIGIVHRDLKPANLFLVQRRDKTMQVKVLDFGISKASGVLGEGSGAMTSTKALLGSPYYMSPEQLRSSKSVDARADIWSMGIIIFELITGQPPFLGDNFGELFASILEMDAPSMASRRPYDVPPQLEHVVGRCLQRKPDNRYSNVGELAMALSPFASSRGQRVVQRILDVMPVHGRPPSMVPAPSQGAQSGATFALHPPMPGASTGSGVFTAPGVQPQGIQTNSSWTGAQVQPRAPTNSVAIVAGIFFGLVGILLVGLFGWRAWEGHQAAAAAAAGSSALSATAPTPIPVIPDTPTANTAATTATATPPASDTASAKPPDPAHTTTATTTHHTTTAATTATTAAATTSHGPTPTPTHATAPSASHGGGGGFDPFGGGAH